MTKDEMENKSRAFITEISEILGLGKPIDILKLCATTDLFFKPLEEQITELVMLKDFSGGFCTEFLQRVNV